MFEKAQAQFTRTTGKISFRDGAIWGPVAGATFDGTIDFAAERINMRGTYVPAYGLNNLFSKLPILGNILGGGPNEGLVGVTFEVAGPMAAPALRINPLSAVAPASCARCLSSAAPRKPRRRRRAGRDVRIPYYSNDGR